MNSYRMFVNRASGYYADQLSTGQEMRGNVTVKVKNKSKGFHLNNLSYAGPIVMGVGGNYIEKSNIEHWEHIIPKSIILKSVFFVGLNIRIKYQ